MSATESSTDAATALAHAIGQRCTQKGLTVAVAESMTCGMVACALGAGEGASTWFKGAVVAYASSVKFDVLGVAPGPVITATCAQQMARGVADLTHSDIGAAITGVGGPDAHEGQPPGTVFLSVRGPRGQQIEELHVTGGPETVLRTAARRTLEMIHDAAR